MFSPNIPVLKSDEFLKLNSKDRMRDNGKKKGSIDSSYK